MSVERHKVIIERGNIDARPVPGDTAETSLELFRPTYRRTWIADSAAALFACGLLALTTVSAPALTALAAPPMGGRLAAAAANPNRPSEDVARDADRKPVETLAFAGVKSGDVVADYIANSGYFTRLFSNAVGRRGHVYAVELNEIIKYPNVAKGYAGLKDWVKARPNVTLTTVPASQPAAFPRKLDMFWISQNYHDLHDKFLGPVDIAAFNRAVFAALKPGGVYIVLDHAAAPDAPANVTETLHRIEPAVVRREVEAAGFRFDGESQILANPGDTHSVGVFDKSIQGRTDQFLYRFRKPRT